MTKLSSEKVTANCITFYFFLVVFTTLDKLKLHGTLDQWHSQNEAKEITATPETNLL